MQNKKTVDACARFYLLGGVIASNFTYCFMYQTYDKARNAVALALSPVVRALVDPDGALRDIRNLDSVRGCCF